MSYVLRDTWHPVGVAELEPAALAAVKSVTSCVVVAGPGSGKTELLAQRAAFLFQTGACPDPERILAISFKKDAATNLAGRVTRRCTVEQSRRFSSVTFDSFTKGIVDRFFTSLPDIWRLDHGYEVAYANTGDFRRFLKEVEQKLGNREWLEEIRSIAPARFESECLGTWRLPLERRPAQSGSEYATILLWLRYIRKHPASLTFTMINRLAELIQRANPAIGRAIRETFRYVFVDECQDTTYAQYDFLRAVFGVKSTVVTAVGDEKQRIMGFAGAHSNIFMEVAKDFNAKVIPLRCNYRSSRELVEIQHVFARRLDQASVVVESRTEAAASELRDTAQIWNFGDATQEARYVAEWIKRDMTDSGRTERDYVLLVRQRADRVEQELSASFAASGLNIRNEARKIARSTVQDVLAEPLTPIVRGIARLATRERDAESWEVVGKAMTLLRGVDVEDESRRRVVSRLENDVMSFVSELSELLSFLEVGVGGCALLVGLIIDYLDPEAIAEVFPEYRVNDNFFIAIESIEALLSESALSASSWTEVLDQFDGKGCVPLMTIHKSKGLEFDSVFFIGLDDDSWRGYKPGVMEELAAFFVGISRAKRRVRFTYSPSRGGRRRVGELYDLLHEAGVKELEVSGLEVNGMWTEVPQTPGDPGGQPSRQEQADTMA